MTKEVAKKIAKGIEDKIECNTADMDDWAEFWGFTREDYEEFLDMPIKTLEQEPKTDVALERYKDLKDYFSDEDIAKIVLESQKEFKTWLERLRWNTKKVDELARKIEVLEQEPKTEWIPVSKELPKDEQEILFSTKTGRVYSGKYHDDDSANRWYSHKDKCRAWNNVVNAWQPLPKAYEEG